MAAGEGFFHWDNALVHTAAVVKDWIAAKDFRLINHPPYSPDLAPADFLLPDHQEAAGGQNTDPGDLQGNVGGGHQDHRRRGQRRRLQALVRALREVHPDWRQIRQETLRNKRLKISYRFLFFFIFPEIMYSHSVHNSIVRSRWPGQSRECNKLQKSWYLFLHYKSCNLLS
jgi:hypothetical protein